MKLTKEMEDRIIACGQKTWDYIAGDTLRCLAECGEEAEMSRADVVGTVIDYMAAYGR